MPLLLYVPTTVARSAQHLETQAFGEFTDPTDDGRDDQLAFFNDIRGPRRLVQPGNEGMLCVIVGPGEPLPAVPPDLDYPTIAWGATIARPDSISPLGFIGVDRNAPPMAAMLRRRVMRPGTPTLLGDGGFWDVPIVLQKPEYPDELDGSKLLSPADRLASRLGMELLERIATDTTIQAQAESDESFSVPGSRTLAEHALQVNYRGRAELWAMLGLLNTPAALNRCCLAAMGVVDQGNAESRRWFNRLTDPPTPN
jgi:hypothetical protein